MTDSSLRRLVAAAVLAALIQGESLALALGLFGVALYEALRLAHPVRRVAAAASVATLALLGLRGLIPFPLALIVSCFVVCMAIGGAGNWPQVLVSCLALQTSAARSLVSLASSAVDGASVALYAGPLVFAAFAWMSGALQVTVAIVTAMLCGAVAIGVTQWDMMPAFMQQLASAIPAVVASAAPWPRPAAPLRAIALILGLTIASITTYATSPPVLFTSVGVLPPEQGRSFEAEDYKATARLMRLIGVPAVEWKTPGAIPSDSLVLLPAIGDQSRSDAAWAELVAIGAQRRLTFLVVADHTNLFRIATRLNRSAAGVGVRWDTTVPPENRDSTRPMGALGLTPFPPGSYLNRGASLRLLSPFAKDVVWGVGWFSDRPSTSAAGSLGDFLMDASEQRGELVLAATSVGWPRFLVVGDSSFLIDRFLVADPRALLWLMAAASLVPAALSDAIVLALALIVASGPRHRVALVAVATTVVLALGAHWSSRLIAKPSSWWTSQDLGQSVFDPRSFSNQIARWVALDGDLTPRLVRHRRGSCWEATGEPGLRVHFGLLNSHHKKCPGALDARIGNCHRLGGVALREGVIVQNGQVCAVPAPARVHLGSRGEAIAFSIKGRTGTDLVILDDGFLSNASANSGNLEWIRGVTRELRSELRGTGSAREAGTRVD